VIRHLAVFATCIEAQSGYVPYEEMRSPKAWCFIYILTFIIIIDVLLDFSGQGSISNRQAISYGWVTRGMMVTCTHNKAELLRIHSLPWHLHLRNNDVVCLLEYSPPGDVVDLRMRILGAWELCSELCCGGRQAIDVDGYGEPKLTKLRQLCCMQIWDDK